MTRAKKLAIRAMCVSEIFDFISMQIDGAARDVKRFSERAAEFREEPDYYLLDSLDAAQAKAEAFEEILTQISKAL